MSEAQSAPAAERPPSLKRWLPEVGLVLAGLAAVSVAVVCWARWKRIRVHEVWAVGACRACAQAQIMFHRNDWVASGTTGVLEYATPYTLLNTQPDGAGMPIQLIDATLAAAQGPNGTPRHGYLFLDMKTIGGKKINWIDDYALCATPAKYGVTGRRTFIINTSGTVWGKDLGESKFLKDYPAKPQTQGWEIAE